MHENDMAEEHRREALESLPEVLTKKEYSELGVPEKLDYLYEVLLPIADSYSYVVFVKKFGVGIGTFVFSVATVGGFVIECFRFFGNHYK